MRMKHHVIALAEAVRLARRELEHLGDTGERASTDMALRRLTELLESEDVSVALAALDPVDDAPSMKSDPPVDLRVPYPWRKH
ncbi:MAG: hypothetical protein ACOY5F_06470 [Pseudomonadota bacterium]|jgi:hypothetical protein